MKENWQRSPPIPMDDHDPSLVSCPSRTYAILTSILPCLPVEWRRFGGCVLCLLLLVIVSGLVVAAASITTHFLYKSDLEHLTPLEGEMDEPINGTDKSGKSTRITMVTPNQLQSTTDRMLAINIDHLPTQSGEFWCVFRFTSGVTLKTHTNLTTTGVTCSTPPISDIPLIPPGQHNFTATLSVRMSQDGSLTHNDFVGTDFVFFDCNRYTSCTSCVTSHFPCDWCMVQHRCTHDTAENCRTDMTIVTGLDRVGPSIRSGPGFCPRINVTNGSSELLVPNGTMKRIEVKVDNIVVIKPQIMSYERFACRFYIEGRVRSANAQIVGDTIYCDAIPFNYNSPAPNITVPFAVVWSGTKPLDNPDNIHILVYRCPAMADNCGMCMGAMDEKYGCGWCQSSNGCEVREQCDNGVGVWLSRNQTCPNPDVREFHMNSQPNK